MDKESRLERARQLARTSRSVNNYSKENKEELLAHKTTCAICAKLIKDIYLPVHVLSHDITIVEYIEQVYVLREEFVSVHQESHEKTLKQLIFSQES